MTTKFRGRPRTPADQVLQKHSIRLNPSHYAFAEAIGEGNLSNGLRAAVEHYMSEIEWKMMGSDVIFSHVICPDVAASKMLVAEFVKKQYGITVVLDHMATGCGQSEPDYPDALAPYLERYRRFETRAISPEIRDPEGINGFVRSFRLADGALQHLPEFNIGTAPIYHPITDKLIGWIGLFSPWGRQKPRFLAFSSQVPAENIKEICRIFRDWEFPDAAPMCCNCRMTVGHRPKL